MPSGLTINGTSARMPAFPDVLCLLNGFSIKPRAFRVVVARIQRASPTRYNTTVRILTCWELQCSWASPLLFSSSSRTNSSGRLSITSQDLHRVIGCTVCSGAPSYDVLVTLSSGPGNLRQLFSRTGWDFTNQLIHKHGAVVKLYGMLWVRYFDDN